MIKKYKNQYLVPLDEASEYFGIPEKDLEEFFSYIENERFFFAIGYRIYIRVYMFEEYIDTHAALYGQFAKEIKNVNSGR